jgi:hypothetical protein
MSVVKKIEFSHEKACESALAEHHPVTDAPSAMRAAVHTVLNHTAEVFISIVDIISKHYGHDREEMCKMIGEHPQFLGIMSNPILRDIGYLKAPEESVPVPEPVAAAAAWVREEEGKIVRQAEAAAEEVVAAVADIEECARPLAAAEAPASPDVDGKKQRKPRAPMSEEAKRARAEKRKATMAAKKGGSAVGSTVSSPALAPAAAPAEEVPAVEEKPAEEPVAVAEPPAAAEPAKPVIKKFIIKKKLVAAPAEA